MPDIRLRRQIALRAAQLMYAREESEYFTAKRKAARQIGVEHRFRPADLPSNREIRDEIQAMANLFEEDRAASLEAMRLCALRLMRELARFSPHLIGSVMTGHVREGSDIDLHVFSDSLSAVTGRLEDLGLAHTVEKKRIIKHNEERFFTHIHVRDRFNIEITLYAADKVNYPFRSSITGKVIERASIAELEALLRRENPELDIEGELQRIEDQQQADVYEAYRLLLLPLAEVKQSPQFHPEGDALYHSPQVFELAREAAPYDADFLLAALLHDVGKAIDPRAHVEAGVAALEGLVSERTLWLVEHHMLGHAWRDGTLGARARRRLAESESLEDLLLLSRLDRAGRRRGVAVGSVEEALDYIRSLDHEPA